MVHHFHIMWLPTETWLLVEYLKWPCLSRKQWCTTHYFGCPHQSCGCLGFKNKTRHLFWHFTKSWCPHGIGDGVCQRKWLWEMHLMLNLPCWRSNLSLTLHGSGTHALALVIRAIVEIISLEFEIITWFPSFATHDSWSFDIRGIVSSGAIDLEKPTPQKNLGLTFDPYDWPSSWSLAFLNLDVVDFT